MDEQGLEDAAILLMSLGEHEAAEVFKHLEPKEVQKLGETIARMKTIPRERFDGVVEKFTVAAKDQSMLVHDTDEYVKAVLRKALGDDKANLLIDRILQGNDNAGIERLKWMDAISVAELLRNEHPQILAAILVHLDPDHAAGILRQFTERTRNEVMLRIATLEGIQPTALKDLNEALYQVLAGGDKIRKSSLGGVKTAAEIRPMTRHHSSWSKLPATVASAWKTAYHSRLPISRRRRSQCETTAASSGAPRQTAAAP